MKSVLHESTELKEKLKIFAHQLDIIKRNVQDHTTIKEHIKKNSERLSNILETIKSNRKNINEYDSNLKFNYTQAGDIELDRIKIDLLDCRNKYIETRELISKEKPIIANLNIKLSDYNEKRQVLKIEIERISSEIKAKEEQLKFTLDAGESTNQLKSNKNRHCCHVML